MTNTIKSLRNSKLTVGFIGGSITDERPGHNWPEAVIGWFTKNFPNVRFTVENAAIGATGSDFAVFRAKRDLIDRGCDLVFIDYAVNDNETQANLRERTREGLIRKLLKVGSIDVVLTYTFCQDMYEKMLNNEVPESISDFELLAEKYQLGSIWMGLYALNEIKSGQMKWEEWLPDGLHPTYRGSYSYSQAVCKFLKDELLEKNYNVETLNNTTETVSLPDPLNPYHWEKAELLHMSEVKFSGPLSIRRSVRLVWADQILETNAIGAKMNFTFFGNGLLLTFDFGYYSSEFRYRIDNGKWQTVSRDRPDWISGSGWLRSELIEDNLDLVNHLIEIEVIHGNQKENRGTNFRLTHIGVIQYAI